jgi:cell division protein FtsB
MIEKQKDWEQLHRKNSEIAMERQLIKTEVKKSKRDLWDKWYDYVDKNEQYKKDLDKLAAA